jgi:hypothetical protein
MGCKNWLSTKVSSLDEFKQALNSARKHKNGVFIEVVVDKYDYGLFEHPKNKKQK